jgi:hypothetical protein
MCGKKSAACRILVFPNDYLIAGLSDSLEARTGKGEESIEKAEKTWQDVAAKSASRIIITAARSLSGHWCLTGMSY